MMTYLLDFWKPIVGFEQDFEISVTGQVRYSGGRIRRTQSKTAAYQAVMLIAGENRRRAYIHQLVAETFIGPRPPGHLVNHKDGHKRRNRVSNLEYVTPAGNLQHASRTGLLPRKKLSPEDMLDIVAMCKTLTPTEIAKQYGVSRQRISDIKHNAARWLNSPSEE